MNSALSPTALSTAKRSCGKPVVRFDLVPAVYVPPSRASDIRFFVTVWAMGFVVFYNFLF